MAGDSWALIGEFKTEEWGFTAWEREKPSSSNGQLSKSTTTFKTKVPQWGAGVPPASLSSVWLAVYLFSMVFLEVDALAIKTKTRHLHYRQKSHLSGLV